jgi:hypothetical protein
MPQERDSEVPNPKPHNFQGNPNLQYSNQYRAITLVFSLNLFVTWGLGLGAYY